VDSNAVEMCTQAVMPNAQSEFYKLLLSLASLVFWLFLVSMVLGIAVSLVHVCILFETPVNDVKPFSATVERQERACFALLLNDGVSRTAGNHMNVLRSS
jgi:hypothetical protein